MHVYRSIPDRYSVIVLWIRLCVYFEGWFRQQSVGLYLSVFAGSLIRYIEDDFSDRILVFHGFCTDVEGKKSVFVAESILPAYLFIQKDNIIILFR